MAIVTLSDQQRVDTAKIDKVEMYRNDLLITCTDKTLIKVHGSGVVKDANLLDEMRDHENLAYLVFRNLKPK